MTPNAKLSTPALLTLLLASAGCASSGGSTKPPSWPEVPPLPQRLLNKTDYAAKVRAELFEPSSSPSPSETKP